MSTDRYVVPSHYGFLEHREPGWQVWSRTAWQGPAETLVLDVRTWPPTVAMRMPGNTCAAARCRDGRWAFHVDRDDAWLIVVWDGEAEQILPVPFGEPDWSRLAEASFEVSRCRKQGRRLDRLCFVGDQLLLVPVFPGAGDGRVPLLGTGDGDWQPVTALPVPRDAEASVEVTPLVLGDGASILVWDGEILEHAGGTFVRSFDGPPLARHCVPTGPDGLFASTQDRELVELHRGQAPRVHSIKPAGIVELSPGPDATLVIGERNTMLYDPSSASVRDVPPALLADHGKVVGWSDAGCLMIERGDRSGARWLDPIWADAIFAAPARRADRVPDPPIVPRVIDGRAASRPRIAADPATSTVVVLDGCRVGVRRLDTPVARHRHACELVAVVARDGVFSILDAEGALYRATAERIAGELGDRFDTGARSPLSMVGIARGAVILSSEGVVRFDGERSLKLPFDAAIAGAEDGAGDVLLVGRGRRAAILRGTVLHGVAPPACEVHAVTSIHRGEWIGLGARGLVRFDGDRWHDMQPLDAPGNHLLGLPDGHLVLATAQDRVDLAAPPRFGEIEPLVVYTDGFMSGGPLEIIGLAMVGTQLIIGLNRDNGNIVTLGASGIRRFDPHPDQPRDSWLFIGDRRFMWA